MSGSEQVRFGRKRALPLCPNPLFLQWLTELRDEARDRGLKTQFTYQKAINSLKKYPLPLQNAKEAKILQNFGDGICKILDEKLQRYYRENGPDAKIHSLPEGAPPPVQAANNSSSSSSSSLVPSQKKNGARVGGESGEGKRKKKKNKDYVPQKRSGGYAVLLSLYRESQMADGKGYMLKHELQTEAQHLCDKSLTVPEPGSKYTAWSSVSTLIQKNLVIKTHNPARYSLTEEGAALAERLGSVERLTDNRPDGDGDGSPGVVDLTCSDEEGQEEDSRTRPAERPECVAQARTEPDSRNLPNSQSTNLKPNGGQLPPGSYDIVLCVDVTETTGASNHRKQELVKELQRNGVNFDVRKLNVGDFLWVAREKVAPVPGQLRAPAGRELVLDYIVERKRMDDLCSSIIDGRFSEQKFRLRRCGLRCPIYLIESGPAAAHLSIPEATLEQAIVNVQVANGFFVKRVRDVRESAAHLTVMTRHLTKLYQNCTLTCRSRELDGDAPREEQQRGRPSCSLISFAEFNQGAVKNKSQTVRDVFARQLMQVSGLSGDKAAAILNHYSTPSSLITAYEQCSSEAEKEKLLSSVRYGKLKRNLGPALSRTIYQLYCTGTLS